MSEANPSATKPHLIRCPLCKRPYATAPTPHCYCGYDGIFEAVDGDEGSTRSQPPPSPWVPAWTRGDDQ